MFFWLTNALRDTIKLDPQTFLNSHSANALTAEDFYAMASAAHQLKQNQKALHFLKLGLQKNLGHLPSLYFMFLLHFQKGEVKEAGRVLQRAFRLDKDANAHLQILQKEVQLEIPDLERALTAQVFCLKEFENLRGSNPETHFQLGKLYFEQSKMVEAAPYFRQVLREKDHAEEATEYLSYIYEHLYKGEELIVRNLELAEEVDDRSDLFFNLAMVCHHEQNRLDLAMHFFYLAASEDRDDPGLKFSLEQAALEYISKNQRQARVGEALQAPPNRALTFHLMAAHLYQGSIGLARQYAQQLGTVSFPDAFNEFAPLELWQKWLLPTDGVLKDHMMRWFSPNKNLVQIRPLTK